MRQPQVGGEGARRPACVARRGPGSVAGRASSGGDVLDGVAAVRVDFVEIVELDDYRDLAVVPQQADAVLAVLDFVWRGQPSVLK
jgi:hypothetical protein